MAQGALFVTKSFLSSPPMITPVVEFQAWELKLDNFFNELFEVVYMCSSLVQLAPGSCDLSQVEKMITVV